MRNQTLVVVDKQDKFKSYASYEECHTGEGKLHRAFVTLLVDDSGKVILQRRKHEVFDDIWDITVCSHPLFKKSRIETFQEASDRALFDELGIKPVEVINLGSFVYFAKDDNRCEREYCVVLVGKYNGDIKPNKDVTYDVAKVDAKKFLRDVANNPKKYAPWVELASKHLERYFAFNLKGDLDKFLLGFNSYTASYFKDKKTFLSDLEKKYLSEICDFNLGGKKLRAYLVGLGYRIAGGNIASKVYPMALAYEFLQTFLLVHDDIIDKSDTRRGKPSMHVRFGAKYGDFYGLSQALLVGDYAYTLALELILNSDFDNTRKQLVLSNFNKTTKTTIIGEGLDVLASFEKPNLGDISKIIDYKSSNYSIIGPLTLGVLCGKTENLDIFNQINKFGLLVGCAFQLHDDYLGVFGNEEKTGKPSLSDMREGKNTMLFLKACELLQKKDKAELINLWGKEDATNSDLEKVKTLFKKVGVDKWSFNEERRLIEEGKKIIPKLTNDAKIQTILCELCDFLILRDK